MGLAFFVTGRPGVGKTSIILNIAQSIKDSGHKIGGMVSNEVKENGMRIGFEIQDLKTSKKGWLAHKNLFKGPRIGRYSVNLDDLENIGVKSIMDALDDSEIELVIIDEIGPMELLSKEFIKAVSEAIYNKKPILGTIHQRAEHFLIERIKFLEDANIILITLENRNHIRRNLYKNICKIINQP